MTEKYFTVFFFLFISLLGICLLASFRAALIKTGKVPTKNLLKTKKIRSFFINVLLENKIFPSDFWEKLLFILSITKHILYVVYAICAYHILLTYWSISSFSFFLVSFLIILAPSLFFDLIFRIFGNVWSKYLLIPSSFFSSFYLIALFPITALFLKIKLVILKHLTIQEPFSPPLFLKDRLIEFLQESGLAKLLDHHDQKMLLSLLTFREKVAREIMIPRVDIFGLEASTTILEATKLSEEEDYSRIPVYKNTVDNIIGVLMFKDLLKIFHKNEKEKGQGNLLKQSIEGILKPVLYSPENKKISHLLQELKTKQIHLAIIVNEYGGTEGIVTIEDILEELVGEIEDEYDIEEERQYWKLPDGSWIVDAKMSIVDIESKLDIKIPHSPEYETIGGYVFHKAGTIPSKGWKLHKDLCNIEVLSSNERFIEKIRLSPHPFEENPS